MLNRNEEIQRRRIFGIISHPDAGKTTLTEKLLLHGGAIRQAGTVKARRNDKFATSDWMEIEKQRGISVTSSVMQFEYAGKVISIMDTPGHNDFGEDTYRILTSVDSAVMVIDGAKGIEAQTRKLFRVCSLRGIPVFTFINNVLMRTSGGLVAITGMVVLVWAAASVFNNVESAFNAIWEVKQSRSLTRKASTYTAVIFILPLLVTLLIILLSYVRHLLATHIPFSDGVLYWVISFALIWLILAAAYKLIPNTKVNVGYAAQAALFAAIAFSAFQMFYLYLQNSVSSYNIIYGSFAAIPLFLFWIQVSWQIILFGAELSFAFQNVNSFVQEQDARTICADNRRKVMVATLLVIIRSYLRNEGGISSTDVAHTLHLPVRLIRDVTYTLTEAEILLARDDDKNQKTKRYVPARDIHDMTLSEVLTLTEHIGTTVHGQADNHYLRVASERLDSMAAHMAASNDNILLTDLLNESDNHR